MKWLLRLLFVVAGLIFATSLMLAMIVLLVLWGLRALWCKLTGKPVNPFVMRMNPRTGFDHVFKQADRRAQNASQAPRRVLDDVTDVEPKR
jgi:type IV secretory pathway component VirB8